MIWHPGVRLVGYVTKLKVHQHNSVIVVFSCSATLSNSRSCKLTHTKLTPAFSTTLVRMKYCLHDTDITGGEITVFMGHDDGRSSTCKCHTCTWQACTHQEHAPAHTYHHHRGKPGRADRYTIVVCNELKAVYCLLQSYLRCSPTTMTNVDYV